LGNASLIGLYDYAYEQGAAEGISHFVSAGDTGGSTCNVQSYGISPGYGVNAIGESQWNVSVGGTEFIMPDPNTYFPPANNYLATGYIPESTWNDYEDPNSGQPEAGGGGVSLLISKPDWQAGPGVPADGHRDLPDVSLVAGDNLSYMVCQRDYFGGDCSQGESIGVWGTSLASPSWASIQALVNQKNALMNGAGNPNPTYYQLAAGKNSPFHDITVGDTKVPNLNGALVGYQAAAGYDLATGLGSVDVNALATSWMPPTGSGQSTVTLDTGGITTITHGDPITANIAVAPTSGSTVPSGDVALMAGTEGVSQLTLDATGKVSAAFGNGGMGVDLPGGTYNLVAHYAGDANFAPADSSPIALTVNPEPTATTVYSNPGTTVPYGVPVTLSAWAVGLNSNPSSVVPGIYTFTENGNVLGASTMLQTGESFAYVSSPLAADLTFGGPQALPAGTHTINASSPPASASFLASASTVATTVKVVPGTVLVSLTPDHTNPAPGSTVNLLVSVINIHGFGVPVTGMVAIEDESSKTTIAQGTLGTQPDASGAFDVVLPVTFATAGLHPLLAVYEGDANNYAGPSGAVDITVGTAAGTKMSTSTTISPGAGLVWSMYALAQTNVSIGATVTGDTGGSAPTGTVTFTDAANKNAVVGTAAVGSNGAATLTTKTLAGGKHFIVANYSGDSNFAASASQAIEVDIADFSVSDSPSSVTVTAGQSAAVTFTYSGSTDFTKLPLAPGVGSVGVSCSGLPQGAQCSFSNAVITPTTGSGGTTSGSVTVTITTTGPSLQVAANQPPHRPLGNVPPLALAGLFAVGLPLIFRKRRTFTVLLGLLLLAVVGTLNGCNGGTTTYSISNPGTVPGTSNVSVTATFNGGSAYGTLSHTATVALIVAPEPTH
jgi:Bacterial Ig-like domain (group 3)